MDEEAVSISVPDGPTLEGKVRRLDAPKGGLVVCHPHPLYGGEMENPVVVRAVEVGWEQGLSTLRFNFRGVGRSEGTHAAGVGERDDARAAIMHLAAWLPAEAPLGLAGYSFGASVAAAVPATDPPVAALALIAPPLGMVDVAAPVAPGRPTLVVAGTRDQYCPVEALEAFARRIPGARSAIIEGADHFFFGKLFPLGEALAAWAREWAR